MLSLASSSWRRFKEVVPDNLPFFSIRVEQKQTKAKKGQVEVSSFPSLSSVQIQIRKLFRATD